MPNAVTVSVRLLPRAQRDTIAGWEGETLRVRVTAPPLDGRANQALIALLSKTLGVPRRAIAITAGERSRDKLVRIEGLDNAALRERLHP